MTANDLQTLINHHIAKIIADDSHRCAGVRYESKTRLVGESIENSKSNLDRSDERDFPRYGTAEYADLPELDGCSTWAALIYGDEVKVSYVQIADKHAYIVVGDDCVGGEDRGEIVIKKPTVYAVLY